MPRASRPDDEIRVDARQFAQLLHDVKAFDRALSRSLRRRLRRAGDVGAEAARREVLAAPTHGAKHTGLRRNIAAGIKVQVASSMSGRGRTGVFIRATSSRLPPEQKRLVRLYNRRAWRHPTWGNREVWVTQTGHPYFYKPIAQTLPAVRREVDQAIGDALDALPKHSR